MPRCRARSRATEHGAMTVIGTRRVTSKRRMRELSRTSLGSSLGRCYETVEPQWASSVEAASSQRAQSLAACTGITTCASLSACARVRSSFEASLSVAHAQRGPCRRGGLHSLQWCSARARSSSRTLVWLHQWVVAALLLRGKPRPTEGPETWAGHRAGVPRAAASPREECESNEFQFQTSPDRRHLAVNLRSSRPARANRSPHPWSAYPARARTRAPAR